MSQNSLLLCCCMTLVLCATGTILGIYHQINLNDDDIVSATTAATINGRNGRSTIPMSTINTLKRIRQRGYIICASGTAEIPGFLLSQQEGTTTTTNDNDNNKGDDDDDGIGNQIYQGLDVDLCRILAAGIFDGQLNHPITNKSRYHMVSMIEPLTTLIATTTATTTTTTYNNNYNNNQSDVVMGVSYTMEKDFYEQSIGQGLDFSSPYYWDTVRFGGIPENVRCADRFDFISTNTCQGTKICIKSGMITNTVLSKMVPEGSLYIVPDNYHNDNKNNNNNISSVGFPADCQVMADAVRRIRKTVIEGPYAFGNTVLSRDPIAIATLPGDPEWSDWVEWMIQALIFAEENNITKHNSNSLMIPTSLEGILDDQIFAHMVSVRGNYGDLYQLHLNSIEPRDNGFNQLNYGDSPLILSPPVGDLSVIGPELEVISPTVRNIIKREFLNCGMNDRLGLSQLNLTTRTYTGFDIDLCRAIAAALFHGADDDAVVIYTDLPSDKRFSVLDQKRVDVLARFTTRTLQRDVNESSTGRGYSFSSTYFYDGLRFGGLGEYVHCAANTLATIHPDCQSLKICALSGTTYFDIIQEMFSQQFTVPKLTFLEIIDALNDGQCNAVAGGLTDVSAVGLGYTGNETYTIGDRAFSNDPLALTTRQDDPVWSDFVRCIVWALIYAEEQGITQATAKQMPDIMLFGIRRKYALYHAVNVVGNYGEIYERHFEHLLPRGKGIHQLVPTTIGKLLRANPGIQIKKT